MSNEQRFKPLQSFVAFTILGLLLGVVSTNIADLPLMSEGHFYFTLINIGAMWATWLLIFVIHALRQWLD